MSKIYLVEEPKLKSIGDSIRKKDGTTDLITIDEMPNKIDPTRKYVQDGLVGFFELNGSCYDYMGNMPIGENTMTFREDGKTHKMARHNGYCRFNAGVLAHSDFSISFWFRSQKIVGNHLFSLGCADVKNNHISVKVANVSEGTLQFELSNGETKSIKGNYLDNEWHHFFVKYSNNNISYSIDNSALIDIPHLIDLGINNIVVGAIANFWHNNWMAPTGMKISNFLIYNKALNEDERIKNYNADKDVFVNGNPPLREEPAKKCEYIQSIVSNKNSIWLDIVGKSNIELDIEYEMPAIKNYYLFGTYNYPRYFFGWYDKFHLGINQNSEIYKSTEINCAVRQIIKFNTIDHKAIQVVDGNEVELGQNLNQLDGKYNIPLFSADFKYFAQAKIYDIVVRDNTKDVTDPSSIIKHFIPCLDEKGVPCLYEEKEKIYYYDDNPKSYSRFDYKEATV